MNCRYKIISIIIFFLFPFFLKAQILQHRIDSLKAVYQQTTSDSGKADILNKEIFYLLYLRNYSKADSAISEEMQISMQSHYQFGVLNAFLWKGRRFTFANEFDQVLPNFLSARKIISTLPAKYILLKQSAKVDYATGVYFMLRVVPDSALNYLEKALTVIKRYQTEPEDKKLLCSIFTAYARTYSQRGNNDSAAWYISKALQMAEQSNDPLVKRDVYWVYTMLLDMQRLYKEEIKYLKEAATISLEYGMLSSSGYFTYRIGDAYSKIGEDKTAYEYYNRALPMLKQYSNKDDYVEALSDYAQNLKNLHKLDKAEDAMKEALSLQNLSKLTFTNYEVLMELCDILHEKKNYNEEWKFLQQAKTLIAPSKLPECMIGVQQQTIKYYEATGNFQEALKVMEKLSVFRDSLNQEDAQKTMAELNTKYEAAQKDKEIAALNADKKISAIKISQQHNFNIALIILIILTAITAFTIFERIQHKRKTEREIALLEQENQLQNIRNKISRDMHDDIGASISKTGILAQQAKQQLQKGSAESVMNIFDKITNQSREMIVGLRTIIWATNPQYDDLAGMLGFMRTYISDFFDGAAMQYKIDFPDAAEKIKINPELKRNLFLVLKESLNNVVKHSSASQVVIRFVIDHMKYHFEITDNGTGMDVEDNKSFTHGLNSMKNRMNEIKGLFRIASNVPTGTCIELEGMLF